MGKYIGEHRGPPPSSPNLQLDQLDVLTGVDVRRTILNAWFPTPTPAIKGFFKRRVHAPMFGTESSPGRAPRQGAAAQHLLVHVAPPPGPSRGGGLTGGGPLLRPRVRPVRVQRDGGGGAGHPPTYRSESQWQSPDEQKKIEFERKLWTNVCVRKCL